MEVGERIVAFDKGKGEEEMTSEEDALQLLSRKRNKEGERQSIQSTKRRKTKPGKPTRRVACKRERTTTESATTEMKSSKRMRKTAQKPEVASVKTTKIHNNKLWQSSPCLSWDKSLPGDESLVDFLFSLVIFN